MKDKLSAWIDGDLDDLAANRMADHIGRDESLRKHCDVYWLIGDALRGDAQGADLTDRIMSRLDAEPTVLAPRPAAAGAAARQSLWQSLMPIAASVMGVAAVGLVAATMYSSSSDPVPGNMVAVQRTVLPAQAVPVSVTVDDPHREYVFVHQAMTGGGPLPTGVQYVRTVSVAAQDVAR